MANPTLEGLRPGIYARLANFSALTAALPKYRGQPAIFTNFIVPADAPLPRVIIESIVGGLSSDTVSTSERQVSIDIYVYVSNEATTTSPASIERIAENVRAALHNIDPQIAGWTCIKSVASGPITAPTDNNFIGRLITIDYWFSQGT